MAKSTVFQIVMANGKYEIWGRLLSHLEGCPSYKKDAAEFSKVFIANGRHDIGMYILSQKVCWGVASDPRSSAYVRATRDITLLAIRH